MADVVPGTLLAADPVEIERLLGGRALPADWPVAPCWCARPRCSRSSASSAATWPARPTRSTSDGHGPRHGHADRAGAGQQLPEPMFTPSTKATEGHDLNIDFAAAVDLVGARGGRRGPGHLSRAVRACRKRVAPPPGSSWPTPSSSSASSTASLCCAMRCHARLLASVAGRPGRARATPSRLRQAAAPRLARRTAVGPHAAPALGSRRRDRSHVRSGTWRPTSA